MLRYIIFSHDSIAQFKKKFFTVNLFDPMIFQSLELTVILWSHASSSVVGIVNFRLPLLIVGFSDGWTLFSVVVLAITVADFSTLFHHSSVNSTSHLIVSLGYIVSFSRLIPIFFISPGSIFSFTFLSSNHGTVTVISSSQALYHGTT